MEQGFTDVDQNEILYQFGQVFLNQWQHSHEYQKGLALSTVEMHTVTRIADNPGITITELARRWNRTKGAVTQMVHKHEEKGLVRRRRGPHTTSLLYPTEQGEKLSALHKEFDQRYTAHFIAGLKARTSPQEVEAFFRVMSAALEMAQEQKEAWIAAGKTPGGQVVFSLLEEEQTGGKGQK